MGVFDERYQRQGGPWVRDCNGDKTADSSGVCDFIESIVALQYHLHLNIIYYTFREKWVLEALKKMGWLPWQANEI